MIQVHNLKKKFDDFQALNGVEMHVGKGDIYGLVGPNGAGKSTLIRHLTGVYKADEGEILIDGEPVFENRNIKQRMSMKIRRSRRKSPISRTSCFILCRQIRWR